jgi:hypothetical protein
MNEITTTERQEKRYEHLPRDLANKIASGKIPPDLLKLAGANHFDALEASVIALRGGGLDAEAWLEDRYDQAGRPNLIMKAALLGQMLAELQSGKSTAAAADSMVAVVPAPTAAAAPNANVPLAETFLALDGPDDADARRALWEANAAEFANPDSVRAWGMNPTTRIDLIRAVWPVMPDKARSQFYGRHSKLLFDN